MEEEQAKPTKVAGGRRPRRAAGKPADGGTTASSSTTPSTGEAAAGTTATGSPEQPGPGIAGASAAPGEPAEPQPTEPPSAEPSRAQGGATAEALGAMGVLGVTFIHADSVDLRAMKVMALVYGDSGAGKTHFASQAEDVVVALVDTQGFATIRQANPRALVAGALDKAAQGQPRLKNMAEVREFFKAAAAGKLAAAGVRTIVLDHVTELQQMMIDEIVAEKRVRTVPTAPVQGRVPGQAAAPVQPATPSQPVAKGPAPEMTKADWGVLATKMRNFLRMLRGLPHHVIVLALAAPSQDEATGRRLTFPKLSGSAQDSLPSYFNIVGYLYKTTIDGQVQRVVMLDGDDRYYTKSYGPLHGIVQADVRLWQRVLAGEDASPRVQGAQPPGGSGSGKPRGGTTQPPPQEAASEEQAQATPDY